jgi:pyruvate dehydrogenase E2 component (dihydrolipoamide acetyltransferase)
MRTRSSPRARRLAERIGVSLALVRASGPGGCIVERDVLRWHTETSSISMTQRAAAARTTEEEWEDEVVRATEQAVRRARAGALSATDSRPAAIILSNLGMYRV